jgi:hypothetical protein
VTIRLHVERLVLDSRWQGMDRAALARAVEAELTRLLASGPPGPGLVTPGAVAELRGADIPEPSQQPQVLGTQIAAALHAGIHTPGEEPA